MPGYIERFTYQPTPEQLLEIEGTKIIDLQPPSPIVGVGSGTILLVGECEDGPFDTPSEVLGSTDFERRFGGLGYTYGSDKHRNVSARKRLLELWNGNLWIRAKYLKASRLILCRVDTSVGEVAFSPLACIRSDRGPFGLAAGQTLSLTTDQGGPAASTALAATVATAAGSGASFPTGFAGGEWVDVAIDSGPTVRITFSAVHQAIGDVVARINSVLGYTAAVENTGEIDLSGIVAGSAGKVEIIAASAAGVLTALGHSVGVSTGAGNVANIQIVTATELATVINGTAGLSAIGVTARADAEGRLVICSETAGSGTIVCAAGTMQAALGLPTTTVDAGVHDAGEIPAGTRVRNAGGDEWVTMQTLSVAEGTAAAKDQGPYVVKVRPALDDGTLGSAATGTVTTLVDQVDFADLTVTNPSGLSTALTEAQVDSAYSRALAATLDQNSVAAEANFLLVARRSEAVATYSRQNALDADRHGLFGRKLLLRAPLGLTQAQAIADVAKWRHERLTYCYPGWQVRIPEIAEVGSAAGLGFTDSGIITVGGDAPLATICAVLPPEEDPGQQTNLIDQFFAVEDTGETLTIDSYKAFKRNGICAPRRSRTAGSIYQSGITSSITSGLTTQARRKMGDFLEDSIARNINPKAKKLNTDARANGVSADIAQFLGELESPDNEELSRIHSWALDDRSGNTEAKLKAGIRVWILHVRTHSSLQAMVLQVTVGETVEIETLPLAA